MTSASDEPIARKLVEKNCKLHLELPKHQDHQARPVVQLLHPPMTISPGNLQQQAGMNWTSAKV
jgi:hypothetical protein